MRCTPEFSDCPGLAFVAATGRLWVLAMGRSSPDFYCRIIPRHLPARNPGATLNLD
jgi:hypothetical protein